MQEMDQKTQEMLAAERKHYSEGTSTRDPNQPAPVGYASEKDAERAAMRALKWLKKHPTATVKQVPGHIREKLTIARQMMGIEA